MGLKKYFCLLFLPILVSECFFNPFKWGRNNNYCGYSSMQSYLPSYSCSYNKPWISSPTYQTMDPIESYPYYGQTQSFKPFMISQQYYGQKNPSYFPYYYNNPTSGQLHNGYSKNWQYSTYQPNAGVNPVNPINPINPISKVNTQQYKLKSY